MKKILFAAVAATVLFASCAKEGNGNVTEGADTYAGISISFPKMTESRAVTPDGNATGAEQKVTTVGVYVVDVNSGTMHSKVYTSAEFTEGSEVYVLNSALKTTTGDKKVYVVLNPTTTVSNEIAAKRGVVFGTASIAATEAAFVNGTTDMVMSGASAATVTLGVVEEAAALAAPVAITVQRNTAKVAVTYKSDATGGVFTFTNGTATVTGFAPITTAKNSYLIQQLASTPISVANVRTPGYSVATVIADNAYWATLAAPETYQAVTESGTANTALKAFYALENVNATNKVGNTTAAIIKATIAPAAGTVVTAYDINAISVEAGITLGDYTTGEDFYVKKSDNTVWSVAAYTAAIVPAGTVSLTADDFSKPYVGGVSYYRIWVQDADGTIGILRNNYYIMQINSISGFGSPTVPGTDPDEPNDPDEPIDEPTFISVSVSVTNWEVKASGHDL